MAVFCICGVHVVLLLRWGMGWDVALKHTFEIQPLVGGLLGSDWISVATVIAGGLARGTGLGCISCSYALGGVGTLVLLAGAVGFGGGGSGGDWVIGLWYGMAWYGMVWYRVV